MCKIHSNIPGILAKESHVALSILVCLEHEAHLPLLR